MPEEQNKEKPSVNVRDSIGVVIGDFATVVHNYWDEKIIKRFGLEQRVAFGILFVTILAVSAGLYFALRPKQKEVMTGEFRIAVASFDEHGENLNDKIGYTIADGLNLRLVDDLSEITVGPKVEIWGPDRIGTVSGVTKEERAASAEKLARAIQAYMVIYGVVEETSSGMEVRPEFYLDSDGFYEGSEVIGQYQLGTSFTLPRANSPAWSYDFNLAMTTRSDIISSFAIGLSYFAIHEYETALDVLQNIDAKIAWPKNDEGEQQGKEVLYALIGFASGKAGKYDITQSALEHSIALNPNYSRPYIGLANLNYILSLKPFEESGSPNDVDQEFLDNCFSYLEEAEKAPEKPPLAEVDTKIHFAYGQCYWLKTYTGELPDYELAYEEFQQVIAAYGDGENQRVRELAAESHARLGLIFNLTGNLPLAVKHYQAAADLLSGFPDRQNLFLKRVDDLQRTVNDIENGN